MSTKNTLRRNFPLRNSLRSGMLRTGLFAMLVAFGAAGCGSGGRETAVVSGEIKYNGKSIEKGHISFFPVSGKGSTAGSEIENGRYRAEGVSLGEMEVRINAPKIVGTRKLYENDPKSPVIPKYAGSLPARFNVKSELKLTVNQSSVQKDFDLKD